MKESSGIYQSTINNGIFVIFGGKIALSINNDNEHQFLTMFQLKEELPGSTPVDKSMIDENCPPVALAFNNTASINILIEHLEEIKKNLNNYECTTKH